MGITDYRAKLTDKRTMAL